MKVGGVSGACLDDTGPSVPGCAPLAKATEEIPEPVHDVQRTDFLPEPVVVISAAKMQLADRIDDRALRL